MTVEKKSKFTFPAPGYPHKTGGFSKSCIKKEAAVFTPPLNGTLPTLKTAFSNAFPIRTKPIGMSEAAFASLLKCLMPNAFSWHILLTVLLMIITEEQKREAHTF